MILPNNRRQYRTWHAPKDVLPLRTFPHVPCNASLLAVTCLEVPLSLNPEP